MEMSIHEYPRDAAHPIDGLDVLITGSCGDGFSRKLAARGIRVVVTSETDPMTAVTAVLSGAALPPAAMKTITMAANAIVRRGQSLAQGAKSAWKRRQTRRKMALRGAISSTLRQAHSRRLGQRPHCGRSSTSGTPMRARSRRHRIEVDLPPVKVGQAITILWRGKPIFIRNRTPDDIEKAKTTPLSDLKDPYRPRLGRAGKPPGDGRKQDQAGEENWLIMIGICTHLGCLPKGQSAGDPKGEYGGWFCVCHGSVYDTAGRIRQGPAPRNLDIPPYRFIDEKKIKIG